MLQIQSSKQDSYGYRRLEFWIYLEFVIWDLELLLHHAHRLQQDPIALLRD
jgi:hypothetical protein